MTHSDSQCEFNLFPGQRTLLAVENLNIRDPKWNTLHQFHISGTLDPQKLEESFNHYFETEPSFRCAVIHKDGAITGMRLCENIDFSLPVIDISNYEQNQYTSLYRHNLIKLCQKPFHLDSGPLFNAQILRKDSNTHILQFSIHHLIFDNPSMRLFYPAVFRAYAGQPLDACLEKEERTRRLIAQESSQTAPIYLSGDVDPNPRNGGSRYNFVIDAQRAQALKAATHSMARGCLAALFCTILQHTQYADIIIGTSIDIRKAMNLEDVAGCFIRHAELSCTAKPHSTLHDVIEQAHQQLSTAKEMTAQKNCHIPLHLPWKYSFVFYTACLPILTAGSCSITPMDAYIGTIKRDLILRVFYDQASLQLNCCLEYNSHMYSEDDISILANVFAISIDTVIRNPNVTLYELEQICRG